MLRNKITNDTTTTTTTTTTTNSNLSAAINVNSSTTTNHNHNNVILMAPERNNGKIVNHNNNNNHQTESNVHLNLANQTKPTHRRGYSYGSYSTNNNSTTNTTTTSTLGRNTYTEVTFLLDNKNYFNNNSDNRTIKTSLMRSDSNDQLGNENNNNNNNQILLSDEHKRNVMYLEQKLRKYKKAITEEQMKCNENVNEYLKLAHNAQPTQNQRIKTVFEKKNQKSSQKITRYQKKMNRLEQEIANIKNGGNYHRHTRERLRDVGTNIKEGISGLSGGVIGGIKSGIHTAGETVITKPKFFKRANADEKNGMEQEQNNLVAYDQETGGNFVMLNSNSHSHSHSTKCTSDDDSSSITSESGHLGVNSQSNSAHYSSSPLQMKLPKKNYTVADIEQLRLRIEERRQDCMRFSEDIDILKNQFQSECTILSQALQDEKYRNERLEEQLNDLTELHQKEIENLKQTISDLEEKFQYQAEERHRDVHEMLESFQTRMSRMEHQQHQHLQQYNLDPLDNSNARALVLKLINVLLTVLQVILLLVATVASILAPILQTRMRMFTSLLVIILLTFVFQHLLDLNTWTMKKLYENSIYLLGLIPFDSTNPSTNNNNGIMA